MRATAWDLIKQVAKRRLPSPVMRWFRRRHPTAWPPTGSVRLGGLRRLRPISEKFGFDRGLPIDRFYIERFLEEHVSQSDVHGRVLEVKEDLYASRLGEASGIAAVDILDIDPANTQATIVADLTQPDQVPKEAFDCVICTQTLHIIYDFRAALSALHSSLRPGGVLLVTVPGITKGCSEDAPGDYWRFTSSSARRVFEELFPPEDLAVRGYGNVLAAAAFLYGLAAGELEPSELDFHDGRYEVLVGIRARKRGRNIRSPESNPTGSPRE